MHIRNIIIIIIIIITTINQLKTLFIVPTDAHYYKIIKVKQSRYRPGVAQRVPGS
jgi:hypothetical protein